MQLAGIRAASQKGVRLHDRRKLAGRSRQHRNPVAEPRRDRFTDEDGHPADQRRTRPKDDVAALDVRPHVVAPRLREHRGEVSHEQLVLAAYVDSAEQGDVSASHSTGFAAMNSLMMRASSSPWLSWMKCPAPSTVT